MITAARRMLSCHFTARRLQRYLDADPAAPLTAEETRRIDAHRAECERCSGAAADFRALHRALLILARRAGPEPAAVDRMHRLVEDLAEGRA